MESTTTVSVIRQHLKDQVSCVRVSKTESAKGKAYLNTIPVSNRKENAVHYHILDLNPERYPAFLKTLKDVFEVDAVKFGNIENQLLFALDAASASAKLFEFNVGSACQAKIGYVAVVCRNGKVSVGYSVYSLEFTTAGGGSGGVNLSLFGFVFSVFGGKKDNLLNDGQIEGIKCYLQEKALMGLRDEGLLDAICYVD